MIAAASLLFHETSWENMVSNLFFPPNCEHVNPGGDIRISRFYIISPGDVIRQHPAAQIYLSGCVIKRVSGNLLIHNLYG